MAREVGVEARLGIDASEVDSPRCLNYERIRQGELPGAGWPLQEVPKACLDRPQDQDWPTDAFIYLRYLPRYQVKVSR